MNKEMKSGLTTGTCAAVAAKAALLALQGQEPDLVEVRNPQGQTLAMKISGFGVTSESEGWAKVIKDGGDDPDITHGAEIVVQVRLTGTEVHLIGGTGVGKVTKKGLQIPVGEAAINPVPRQMILWAVQEVLEKGQGVEVTVIVPEGEKLALKTLNPRLGIEGGISILGTTGIVRPMSEEAFKESLLPHLEIIRANDLATVVLVPGGMGEKSAEKIGCSPDMIAQMSNFVGFMLQKSVERHFKEVILFGHIGKLAKVAAGTFHTHNKMGDGRREVIAALAAQAGASPSLVSSLLDGNTAEETLELLDQEGLLAKVTRAVAERAAKRSEEYIFGELRVGIVLTRLSGEILSYDSNAAEIGRRLGWTLD